MSKTVKEHFDDCKQIREVIDNANSLLEQAQIELITARAIFEKLREYQHPKMSIPLEYMGALTKETSMNPVQLIDLEISRINKILGDRA